MLRRVRACASRIRYPALTRVALMAAGGVLLSALSAAPAGATVTTTPRDFTGYGFDQCLAPTQSAMDAWLTSSPYWAVGIYISGDSRACRDQPNLTPTWVETQLAHGWRLLPITLGPQASCNPRFPRYRDDVRIDPSSTRRYRAARRQGRAEAAEAMAVAQSLGIGEGSTLWYDVESYDITDTACRESALWFTSAWTRRLHRGGYFSGVYSSASTGIRALDDARVERPATFALPDRIWIARWDGVADTSTSYLRSDGWLPGGRMKQYDGDHTETWGGVSITIDSNWLDLGRGSTPRREPEHCGGVRLSFQSYRTLRAENSGLRVRAAQCLLTRQGYYSGPLDGVMTAETLAAVRALRRERGLGDSPVLGPRIWTSMLSSGRAKLVKYGAAGERTRRLQRALNAAIDADLAVTGTFEASTTAAVERYQARVGTSQTGVVTDRTWAELVAGRR